MAGGIGKELLFGLDNFQNPKVLSNKDSIAQLLLNLFFMRPGNLPGLPHIGINIKSYIYKFEEDLHADELKQKIYLQTSDLIPYISLGEVQIFVTQYKGKDLLIISVPIYYNEEQMTVLYGFGQGTSDSVLFNYQIENDIIKEI